eukprot:11042067-Ditylum_brightwellii.AAC.1
MDDDDDISLTQHLDTEESLTVTMESVLHSVNNSSNKARIVHFLHTFPHYKVYIQELATSGMSVPSIEMSVEALNKISTLTHE